MNKADTNRHHVFWILLAVLLVALLIGVLFEVFNKGDTKSRFETYRKQHVRPAEGNH